MSGTLPFLSALNHGIVNLDDYFYLVSHDEITSGLGMAGLKFAFSTLEDAIWMPATWISYMIDFSIAGKDNWGFFHAHSILLHSFNGILILLLFIRILRIKGVFTTTNVVVVLLATAFWTAHPLRCESVVFLSSRKDVLSFLLELLALHAWISQGQHLDLNKWVSRSRYCFAIFCFCLAGMAKPSVMTFPVLCLLVDCFLFRRIRIARYVLPLGLAAVLGWFAGYAQAAGGATEDVFGMPFWARLVNAGTALGLYIWNTLWPLNLAVQCTMKWPDWPRFCLPGLAITFAILFYLYRRISPIWTNRSRKISFNFDYLRSEFRLSFTLSPILIGLVWYSVSILPMLGIAKFGYHAQADRFTYIPSVGLSLALAGLLFIALRRMSQKLMTITCFIACFPIGLYAFQSSVQTTYWEDDRTLFSHTLEVDGDSNATAHGVLANWYFEFPHDLQKCIEHFEKMKALNLRFLETSFHIYVFALCESGRSYEVPSLLRWYDNWIVNDIEQNPKWGKDSHRAGFMRTIYHCARLSYLITQPSLRAVAEEDLKSIRVPQNDATFLYLKWRLMLAKDDALGAERARRELIEHSVRKGYTQFRYLTNGKAGK